jgi:hypothetical protein
MHAADPVPDRHGQQPVRGRRRNAAGRARDNRAGRAGGPGGFPTAAPRLMIIEDSPSGPIRGYARKSPGDPDARVRWAGRVLRRLAGSPGGGVSAVLRLGICRRPARLLTDVLLTVLDLQTNNKMVGFAGLQNTSLTATRYSPGLGSAMVLGCPECRSATTRITGMPARAGEGPTGRPWRRRSRRRRQRQIPWRPRAGR